MPHAAPFHELSNVEKDMHSRSEKLCWKRMSRLEAKILLATTKIWLLISIYLLEIPKVASGCFWQAARKEDVLRFTAWMFFSSPFVCQLCMEDAKSFHESFGLWPPNLPV